METRDEKKIVYSFFYLGLELVNMFVQFYNEGTLSQESNPTHIDLKGFLNS